MRTIIIAAVTFGAFLCLTSRTSATVHEITGQWCADRGTLEPHGISGGSNADNFAQPLNAMDFVMFVPGFDPDGAGPMQPGLLITFDFAHPASKIKSTGIYIQIDDSPVTYFELFALDTSKGFTNCKAL